MRSEVWVRVGSPGPVLGIENFGDPEIEQLRNPVAGDENVPRLDVPMDHHLPMRELDGRADRQEQPQQLGRLEVLPGAKLIDGLPLDELHDVVRESVVGRAAVEQPRDVGVIEARQDLPLIAEPAQNEIGVHAALDDLDRHLLLEMIVVANGLETLPPCRPGRLRR